MNACVLIPIYNHREEIRGVVESLACFELPCLIVDDDSDAPTRAELERIERDFSWVEVHHREKNGGKGEALKTGYRLAARRTFTHAIQLDADAQHDCADVPRFLEAIKAHPEALVLGVPAFDDSAPISRLLGRQLSRAMVWICTLSTEIRDPLCGFRGIPLEPVLRLLDGVETGNHMEFDPELTVRLYWTGLPVVSLPTRVVYNPNGLSHFDVIWDDLRLGAVYTRLLGGMFLRLPRLFGRRAGQVPR